jgi:hypothetical protein
MKPAEALKPHDPRHPNDGPPGMSQHEPPTVAEALEGSDDHLDAGAVDEPHISHVDDDVAALPDHWRERGAE